MTAPRRQLRWYRITAMLVTGTVACAGLAFAGLAVFGGRSAPHPEGHHPGTSLGAGRSVADLVDPSTGAPDVHVDLVARKAKVPISTGQVIDGWTWGGTVPGPLITVRQGDLLEVSVRNDDVEDGVTVHWHGVDVPNAMDGVAGVTQEALLPGDRFVYRFRPQQAGTFWYHTHQNPAAGVARGLFGAFVVLPSGRSAAAAGALPVPPGSSPSAPAGPITDRVLLAHTWSQKGRQDVATIGLDAGRSASVIAPGTLVRLRLINTDSLPQHWAVSGTAFTIAAIDGTDVHRPATLQQPTLTLGAGGRYDVVFPMPAGPVAVGLLDGNRPQQVLLPPGASAAPELIGGPEFDPLAYGTPMAVPFTMHSRYDVEAEQKLQTHRVFDNGAPTTWWTINGKRAPEIPMITVDAGDTVRVHILNASDTVHPMHLHGHHVLMLQRNGVASSGSAWWADTVNLDPGDDVWVAFRADNPGIWMDHCHNLGHAAAGMLMHVGYRHISTPFGLH